MSSPPCIQRYPDSIVSSTSPSPGAAAQNKLFQSKFTGEIAGHCFLGFLNIFSEFEKLQDLDRNFASSLGNLAEYEKKKESLKSKSCAPSVYLFQFIIIELEFSQL